MANKLFHIFSCSQPVKTGYRNKCEFSIATCSSTNQPVVGFRLGSYEEGEFTVVSADTCAHVPHRMKQLAKVRNGIVDLMSYNYTL